MTTMIQEPKKMFLDGLLDQLKIISFFNYNVTSTYISVYLWLPQALVLAD